MENKAIEKIAKLLFIQEYPEHAEWDILTIRLQCPITFNKYLKGAEAIYDAGYRHIPELQLLTDEEQVKAQEEYIKRAYNQIKVTLYYPLTGWRRDEALLIGLLDKIKKNLVAKS